MKTTLHLYALALLIPVVITGAPGFADDQAGVKKASEIADALGKRQKMSVNAAEKVKIDIHAIHFALNSSDVEGDESYRQIRELARALEDPRLRNKKIEVQGHTCDLGDEDYNRKLSQKRAEEVVRVLSVQYGIPAENLVAVGKGESEPLKKGTDENSRAENRRVTFVKQ
ncbi:MAG: OmpA family protein [Verrucomicrobiae bacterium]|nr:OmpA family protein [Verrucomicrobiae bacterium]